MQQVGKSSFCSSSLDLQDLQSFAPFVFHLGFLLLHSTKFKICRFLEYVIKISQFPGFFKFFPGAARRRISENEVKQNFDKTQATNYWTRKRQVISLHSRLSFDEIFTELLSEWRSIQDNCQRSVYISREIFRNRFKKLRKFMNFDEIC